ncbi:PREDICTED: uncharacterized protein LOC108616761 isoform X1 [Drosophila arizonae]|uniref:Uncharacterized protein LOC108616761 isoform X1 n=1 Tax=Drosophila arizonae TaxID=7263 RepID=A0ABM1PKD4_DROAR|nr:PREDICTED: uncharacterized protein LOC108616761 isoform X1 [Drosophila arizonae]
MGATGQKRKLSLKDICKLIRLYRANDCLWNPKSSSFRNLEMKERAWQRISHLFNNGLSADAIKLQILSLRYYFATEMLAIKRCKLGGYPHVPKQPYFKELQFLKDAIEPSVSAKAIESEVQDQINCIVEDAFLLSNSESSIHSEQVDFHIPSSNEYTFANPGLQSHDSEPRQLLLPPYDMDATILLPIRCESGCDRWQQASYYEDEDENYVRRPSGSENPNERNQIYGYYSSQSVNNEHCSRNRNSQWALAYAPQMNADYSNTLNTNMYAEVTYPKCACAPKKKVLTGRYKIKSKSTDGYYDGEGFQRFVEPIAQRLQFRCTNDANYNTSSDYHRERCYRNVSRHTSGDEQLTPCNKCVGVNCQINYGTYPPLEADSAGYDAYPQKDYGAVCGYNRNNRQMTDKANDPLADDEPEAFVGICNESNCPKSQFYKQAAQNLENNDYQNDRVPAQIKHRPCDDNPDYGDEQYCRNNPEMQDRECEPTGKCRIGRQDLSKATPADDSARQTSSNRPGNQRSKKKYCTNDKERLRSLNNENVILCPSSKQPQVENDESNRPMQQTGEPGFEAKQARSPRRYRDEENTSTPKRQSLDTARTREDNNSLPQTTAQKSRRNSAQQQQTYSMETVPEDAQQGKFDTMSNDSRGDKLLLEPSNRQQSEPEYDRSRDNKGISGEEYKLNHSQRQRENICRCSNYQSGRSTRKNQNYTSYPVSNTQRNYYEVDADYDRVNGRSRQEDYREIRAYNPDTPERFQSDRSNVRSRSNDNNRPRSPTTDNYRNMPEYDSDMPDRFQTGSRNDGRRTDDKYRSRPLTNENYRDRPEYNFDTRERMQTGSRNDGRRTDSNNRSRALRNEIYGDITEYDPNMPEAGERKYTYCYSGKYDHAKESAYTSPIYNNDVIDDDEYNACVRQCLPKKYQSTDYNRKAYNDDNVPTVQENFRGNGNSNLKYEAEENGYERQQGNRIDEYTACNSECPVHQENSRYTRTYQNEEPDYQNQQAPQDNLYVACHSECPFRQEGSRYQDCNSRKYQRGGNNYDNDQKIRAEEYATSPSNQYKEDYGKTYENFNNQNDVNQDCQCEESLLPVHNQSTVEHITDDINVIRYIDCIPEKCPAQQANLGNTVEEMLDCECPTDEEELQKSKADQAEVFKTNIVCQCEAAVETDLDMSLHDRNTPRKESACECPEAAVNATVVSQNGIEEKNYKSNDGSPLNQKPRPPKVIRRKICSCKQAVLFKNKNLKSTNGGTKPETSKQRSSSPAGTKSRPSSKRQSRVEDDNLSKFQGHGGQRCNQIFGIHNGGKNISLGAKEHGYSIQEQTVISQPCDGMSMICSFEVPAILAEKTIDVLSNHIASNAPPDVDVKPAGSRRSLPGEMPPKNGGSGTETSNLGCRYRSNPFLKLNYEVSKGNIIVWHPPAQGFRASKNSFSMKDCKIDNSQASKLDKSTPPLPTR